MRSRRSIFVVTTVGLLVAACGGGPSKTQALEQIQASVKEDGSCTLPIDVISKLKVQYASKGICIPKEGADKAKKCLDALVAANAAKRMPDDYMLAWPDEVASASLNDVSAYDRKARNLLFSTCVELTGNLRVGMFTCADARADKILKVTPSDDAKTATVRYERELGMRPSLSAIEAACGTVTPPPREATATFVKDASGWKLKPPDPPAP